MKDMILGILMGILVGMGILSLFLISGYEKPEKRYVKAGFEFEMDKKTAKELEEFEDRIENMTKDIPTITLDKDALDKIKKTFKKGGE